MNTANISLINIILAVLSVTGFLLTLVPSILNWQGITGPENVNLLMFIGTIVWFGSASFLLGKKQEQKADDQENV